MKKAKNSKVKTTQRALRLPETMDEWIVNKASQGGYRSPQELIMDIIRDYQERDMQKAVA